MKKTYTILISLLITASTFAQSPEKMSYQAVIRNINDALVTNTSVGMQISILQGSASGTAAYVETQTPTSNTNGLVSLEIGAGTIISGTFLNIDWSAGPYFIKTETDPTGGTNYTISGTSQLLSMPYALYAKTSGSSTPGPQGVTGSIGAIGPTGAIGATGSQGQTGATGVAGIQGQTGAIGTQGQTGSTGVAGIQGQTGAIGTQGQTGVTGVAGIQGQTGAIGTQGQTGSTGVAGIQGQTGAIGTQGQTGVTGVAGIQGQTGLTGSQGQTGTTGIAGIQGQTGATGAQGLQGNTGATGVTGADGVGGVAQAGTNINIIGAGTITSPYVINSTGTSALTIGQSYQGGKIFWLDSTGQHGLIAATADQIQGIQWDNGSNTITNAVRDGIGAGIYNTERIIANESTGNYAAQICANYQGGDYGDWYLPSKYELNLLYLQRVAVGGFTSAYYRSSTESNISTAWAQSFLYGTQNATNMSWTNYVRAIRAF